MPTPDPQQLHQLLNDIEAELQQLELWTSAPPPASAFDSTMPFFADRMAFEQWLQWVFIARFRALLDGARALPDQCNVAPMAEEALKPHAGKTAVLIALLEKFDQQF